MALFKRDSLADYSCDRGRILEIYKKNMLMYLSNLHPDKSEESIMNFINKQINQCVKIPDVNIVAYPQYGVQKELTMPLDKYLKTIKSDILTPDGSVYKTTDQVKSILSEILEEFIVERNVHKHKEKEAEAVGDDVIAQNEKLLQSSVKIATNSMPGQTGYSGSFFYNIINYNSITAGPRLAVKSAYAHTEHMLAGNLYLTSLDSIINYCISTAIAMPDSNHVESVVHKYNLHIPSPEEFTSWIEWSASNYMEFSTISAHVHRLACSFSNMQRTFIFYSYNWYNLLQYNKEYMASSIDTIFNYDISGYENIDPNDAYKLQSDLRDMCMALNYDVINKEPEMDKAIVNHPDGVKKFVAIYRHVDRHLHAWSDLFDIFFKVNILLPNITRSDNIIRRVVPNSDTDSVFFSTKYQTSWYDSENVFSDKAMRIAFLTTYILSMTLEHVFGILTANMGISPKDRGLIKMKNEFFYPVFFKTGVPKHYGGPITVREGKVLPKVKMDIKGVVFRGSDLPKPTSKQFDSYFEDISMKLMANGHLSMEDVIVPIVKYEHAIYNSLMNGDNTYLKNKPIKEKDSYKDDPMTTNYFYYTLWQEVFSHRFGDFIIPNKGLSIPIRDDGKHIFSEEWLSKLRAFDLVCYNKLMSFREQHGKKKISCLILPPTLASVPEIFRDLIWSRSVIYNNNRPVNLLLKVFGISFENDRYKYIASDFYSDLEVPM